DVNRAFPAGNALFTKGAREGPRSGVLKLRGQVADRVRVHRDARAQRRGDHRLLDVTALRGGRLEPLNLLHGGGVVLHELARLEGRLADDEVQIPVPVDPELDLAALDVADGLADVHRDGAGLRVRHEA